MAHEGARFAFAASARNGPFTSALRQGKALIEPRLDPACLVEGAIGTSTIVAFGQRPESLLRRRRRARPVVPEQTSLFSLQAISYMPQQNYAAAEIEHPEKVLSVSFVTDD